MTLYYIVMTARKSVLADKHIGKPKSFFGSMALKNSLSQGCCQSNVTLKWAMNF